MQTHADERRHARTITAKQTELMLHKEKGRSPICSPFKQGETTLADIYVSQLGQVLTAKALDRLFPHHRGPFNIP